MIRTAKKRILISSLYIGTEEVELVSRECLSQSVSDFKV